MSGHASLLMADAKCGGCGAPVAWKHTVGAKGARKAIPINPEADPVAGNIVIDGDVATVVTRGQAAGMRAAKLPLFTSHFRDCPNADSFRKKAAAKGARR